MRRTNSLLALSVLAAAVLACRCQPEPPQPPNKEAAVKLELDGPRRQASISPGERTTYAVEVPAGSGVYLYLLPELGLNLNAEVRDEAGFPVATGGHNYSSNTRYALVTFASRHGGNYYVTLSPAGGAGRYDLEAKGGCGGGRIDRLPVLTRGGQTFQAELGDYPNFADYVVEADERKMVFTVDPDYGVDARISIHALDCRPLVTLDSHPVRRDGLLLAEFDSKFRRRYVVRVTTSAGGGGKFKIFVR